MVAGLELAMQRRQNCKLWNLTIDEFAGYVANGGLVKTLALRLRPGCWGAAQCADQGHLWHWPP
jgi:hypothetical protein